MVDKDDLKADMEILRADLANLKEDLKAVGESFKNQAAQTSRSARDAAVRKWDDSTDTLRNEILERPMTSVAVAFGAGLIVGKLMHCK